MLAELFWFVPLQIIYCAVVYSFVVRYEGAYLTDRYGAEYLAYADRVPKWFPLFKRSGVKRPSVKQYLFPSIFVETYNVVYLLPYLIKEVIAH